jgi:hypothetical protein
MPLPRSRGVREEDVGEAVCLGHHPGFRRPPRFTATDKHGGAQSTELRHIARPTLIGIDRRMLVGGRSRPDREVQYQVPDSSSNYSAAAATTRVT